MKVLLATLNCFGWYQGLSLVLLAILGKKALFINLISPKQSENCLMVQES